MPTLLSLTMCTLFCYWLQLQQSRAVFDHQLLVSHQNWIKKKKTSVQLHLQDLNSSHAAEPLKGVFAPSCDNGQKVQVWIGMSVSGTVCGCEQGVTHFYSPPLHLKTWAGRNRQLSCEYHTGQHGYRPEERGSKRGIPGEKGETIFCEIIQQI